MKRRERCPMCLADDVDGNEFCRCGVRLERRDGHVHRAYRRAAGRIVWQLVFQRRSNATDDWYEGFTNTPHRLGRGQM